MSSRGLTGEMAQFRNPKKCYIPKYFQTSGLLVEANWRRQRPSPAHLWQANLQQRRSISSKSSHNWSMTNGHISSIDLYHSTTQIIHEKPNNWKLQIQFTKRSDEGLVFKFFLPKVEIGQFLVSSSQNRNGLVSQFFLPKIKMAQFFSFCFKR